MDDPARWGPWAVPCPVKAGEIPDMKVADRHKSRMDQRTRERLAILPALTAATSSQRPATAERLAAAQAAVPGTVFTAAGQTLRRAITTRANVASVWAENPAGGAPPFTSACPASPTSAAAPSPQASSTDDSHAMPTFMILKSSENASTATSGPNGRPPSRDRLHPAG